MEERLCFLGLSRVRGLGPRRLEILLSYFGSAYEVWKAKASSLYCLKGIPTAVIDDLLKLRQKCDLEKYLTALEKDGIAVCTIADDEYPGRLKNIHTAPVALYFRGTLPDFNKPTIAIVGARRATPYGLKTAGEIAAQLARAGVNVISGMARGIDSAAHKGCIAAEGSTVAVLGTGVDVVYPRENKRLMEQIIEKGAVISEYPPGTRAEKGHFPSRNRIVSGLSHGVLVVEAASTSGSLITADLALEQGRDVYAVPGPVNALQSKGTNGLIKQGAKLVDTVADILEDFGIEEVNKTKADIPSLSSTEAKVLEQLGLTPLCIEYLVEKLSMPPAELTGFLTMLELKGLIKRLPGQRFTLNY